MDFEYDLLKSELNKSKHGIDFEEAKALWNDGYAIEIATKFLDEERFLVIGKVDEVCWTAVITYRGTTTRFISVRRSRDSEVTLYEESKGI